MSTETLSRLVDPENGLIDRSIFTNRDIFEQEQERIFTRAWLFVGHESQIPEPGDFVSSRMGTEPVILCRDRERRIRVYLNSCRHRGMKVCLYDEGNTQVFTCPYHAWSFGLDGSLVGLPQQEQLYPGMDKSQWSLIEVAQLENYKGSIWATWDAAAPPFLSYLGGAKEHLDLTLEHRDGSEGGSEAFVGVHKWVVPCNWKLPSENFLGDTCHNISHRSVDLVGIGPSAARGTKGRRDGELDNAQHLWVSFPGGHGAHSAMKPADAEYIEAFQDNPVVAEYYRHCYEERKRRLGDKSRLLPFIGTMFPNTSYHGGQPRALCVWHPQGPEEMEIWRIFLVDVNAPPEVKELLRRYYMRYSVPAGMTEQDDMENWNYVTAGARGPIARRHPFNYQQSIGKVDTGHSMSGRAATQVTEENARQYYRHWGLYMEGADWDRLYQGDAANAEAVE
jgi:phenylpropionate dioxygenase-like ring-hydroxylating dioxygenase large terminal subunit